MLTDDKGATLAQIPAKAEGEWTTANFVPFTATLIFTVPPNIKTGSLILKKDNPSGLPEKDDNLDIPVMFAQ